MGANDKAWHAGYEHGIKQCKHHHGERVGRILEKLSEANREIHSVTNRLDDSLLSWKSQQRDLDDLRRSSIDTEGVLRKQLEHVQSQLERVQVLLKTSEAAEVDEGLRYSGLRDTHDEYVENARASTVNWRKRVTGLKEQINDLKSVDAVRYGHLREQIDNLTEKNGNQYDIIKGHHVLQEKGEKLRAAESKIRLLTARIVDGNTSEQSLKAKVKTQHLAIKNGRTNERDMKVRITRLNILITDSKVDKNDLNQRIKALGLMVVDLQSKIDTLSGELVNQAEQFDDERTRVAATGIRAWANRVRFDDGIRRPVSKRNE